MLGLTWPVKFLQCRLMPQSETMPSPNPFSMFIEPCTEHEIINITNNLNNSKGIGLDGYSVKVVKYVINDIAYPLCKIFNQLFLVGIFSR